MKWFNLTIRVSWSYNARLLQLKKKKKLNHHFGFILPTTSNQRLRLCVYDQKHWCTRHLFLDLPSSFSDKSGEIRWNQVKHVDQLGERDWLSEEMNTKKTTDKNIIFHSSWTFWRKIWMDANRVHASLCGDHGGGSAVSSSASPQLMEFLCDILQLRLDGGEALDLRILKTGWQQKKKKKKWGEQTWTNSFVRDFILWMFQCVIWFCLIRCDVHLQRLSSLS